MDDTREQTAFKEYLARKGLKASEPRAAVLKAFLGIERHVTAEELFRLVRRKHPSVGLATVYRTLALLCECGLGRELAFDDGTTRYEHAYDHEHHDHLICTRCGQIIEVVNPEIERLQTRIFQQHGFQPQRHRLDLYGICEKCRR
jgi:Fur family ferric uptake transcriptional regulator